MAAKEPAMGSRLVGRSFFHHSPLLTHSASTILPTLTSRILAPQRIAARVRRIERHFAPLLLLSASAALTAARPHSTAAAAAMSDAADKKVATFAAGCFWSVELIYQREPGVLQTEVGYTGGHTDNPTYKQTCSGTTGHAEAVRLEYDPSQVSYQRLLDIFFAKHDPTTLNRQGADVGSQYRSAIFYHDEEQKALAAAAIEAEQKRLGKPVVTQLEPAGPWWKAEDYHQRYLEKGGQCSAKGDKTPIRCYG